MTSLMTHFLAENHNFYIVYLHAVGHSGISTVVSTQKFTAIHPIIRVNATELFVFRLRNFKDLEAFVEEVSALIDKKTLLEIYNIATEEPYSFLFVKLNAKKRDDMFFVKYD